MNLNRVWLAKAPWRRTILLLLLALTWGTTSRAAEEGAERRRVYSQLLEPREHPDDDRRPVKPPNWATFGRRTQFTALRGFNVQDDRIVDYAEELEKFSRTHELGDVIWPSYPILFAKNLGDFADEIRRRNLYLFDIWGYVPGSGPGGYWQQFQAPSAAFAVLEAKLGERWLGTDIGEQDGRYIGGYANQMTPAAAGRFEQYLNFQRHFERMGDDLGHKHATLVSLNFGHYFLKEGTYTLIGAETAQALPNNQVYYAFIRGAGKQYGVPWFGNASIFNRWGFKTYGSSGRSDGYDHGPTKGTSLSLMQRLLYSHILFNSVAVGFENGWLDGDRLTPIGHIQQAAQRWVKQHGPPGVLHTPVALLLDFQAGWSFPRHLYTDKLYRVWGNLPYGPGDYQTDALLQLLYPGYADASYFHDESGFIAATPYGDIADCLLSDAPLWLLQRYPVLVVAGELSGGRELRDKLEAYVRTGGHLVLTAGNLDRLPGGVAGVTRAAALPGGAAGLRVPDGGTDHSIELLPLAYPTNASVLTWTSSTPPVPLALRVDCGRGQVTVLACQFAVPSEGESKAAVRSEVDRPLISPRPLWGRAREILNDVFRAQRLFEVDSRLALITCRKGPGEYVLGVLNNTWGELPLQIRSHCGEIVSRRGLELFYSPRGDVGYLPEGIEGTGLGSSTTTTIAGGDVRVFAVRVEEMGVEEIPHAKPPARPRGRLLPLRAPRGLKEELLARPTFFEHFDGVIVDWRYLGDREAAALASEARWLQRQGVRVMVDLSSGLNLYPTLRLINNLATDYAASRSAISNLFAKMETLGARDLVLSLHRHPENNFSEAQTRAAFDATLKGLADEAAGRRITLHLRLAFGKPPWSLADAATLLNRVGAPNLRLAPSTALLIASGTNREAAAAILKERTGLWLASAPRKDLAGQLWDAHGRLQAAPELEQVRSWLSLAPGLPVALDAVYTDRDEEYLDAEAVSPSTEAP